ncbi:hypothetical protein KXW54_006541 [Aspergillus fumigatus]|nr:hypothetical protein KXW21_001951 [Aspergillus fumigatus]KAH2458769.1 hypothetical protein KXV71_006970 [Aspergillus fumigatus]KAH2625827.1 hypothetical protein KXW54_006541 [Aspergillus fumigatus]KAH2776000.1 hypothetical protein KXV54_005680 [Aspergillus fumigatus]KAH2830203.1 hypothetical protein KXV85_007717 [Aspergillus fumigatus]
MTKPRLLIILTTALPQLHFLGSWNIQSGFEGLSGEIRTDATGALVAAPFLLIRSVYGLLYYGTNYYTLDSNGQYTAHQSLWNPITGNHVAFALMGLLSEVQESAHSLGLLV